MTLDFSSTRLARMVALVAAVMNERPTSNQSLTPTTQRVIETATRFNKFLENGS